MTPFKPMGNSLILATSMVCVHVLLVTAFLNLFVVAHCSNQHFSFKILVGSRHMPAKSRIKEDVQTHFFINKLSYFTFFGSDDRPSADWLGQHWTRLWDAYAVSSTTASTSSSEWGGVWEGSSIYFSPLLGRAEMKHFLSKPIISFSKGSRPLMSWWSQEYLIYLWEALEGLMKLWSFSSVSAMGLFAVNSISSHLLLFPLGF